MGASAVEIANYSETRALLARFGPDLLKRLDRKATGIARNVKAGAQANFALTGVTDTAYRIRTRDRVSGFSKAVTTTPGSVGPGQRWSTVPGVLASAYEFLNGVRSAMPQNVQRVRSLVETLNAKYGPPGRFLWDAWDERGEDATAAMVAEVHDVEAEYTRRMA